MSSSGIKEKQKSLQSAIEALQNLNQEIQTLKDKKKDFDFGEGSIAENAKIIRKKTLLDFVLGRVPKDEVNAANEAVFKAEQDGKFQEEMAKTIEDVLLKMASQIPNLQKAIESAKGELWAAVYDGIKLQAQKTVGDLPVLAMAAGSRIGKSPQATLLDLFGTGEGPNKSIHFGIINSASAELAKEYGLSD